MARSTFVTTSGAARILQCGEATVRKQADRGELPVIRLEDGTLRNGVRLFDREVIERVARERAKRRLSRQAPTSPEAA